MNIEKEIFKQTKINFNKLIKYGFIKDDNIYKYSKNIMNNAFRVDIKINNKGIVKGTIYDLSFKDEYTNFRIEDITGSFTSQVKDEFINILIDIKNKCFIKQLFIYDQTNRIAQLIKDRYDDEPNFEWKKFPGYATFKNSNSKKWYGLIMNLNQSKLKKGENHEVEILNIKLNSSKINNLLKRNGFLPAYHMNKKNWISIILNNTIPDTEIMDLIDESYSYTVTNNINSKNEWIIPANPKYFDIEQAIKEHNIIQWKQSTSIKINDIIYLYVTNPYSSIMYKFKVLKVNIPYKYEDRNLKINKVMEIKLLAKFGKGKLPLDTLKEYGIKAIRGPRYMPISLSNYINKINS